MIDSTMEAGFPDKLFRGIPNNSYKNGILLQEAFNLDPQREDGYCEISITWDDESESLDVIMSQINERTQDYQFRDGIAEICRKDLDSGMKPQMMLKNLWYERRPTSNNKYHGNILVKGNLDRGMKMLIKSQLAFLANQCIHPNKYLEKAVHSNTV